MNTPKIIVGHEGSGKSSDGTTILADCTSETTGWRLVLTWRLGAAFTATLVRPGGKDAAIFAFVATAEEALSKATGYLGHTLGQPHVASVLLANAVAELKP